ncbi:MAG: FAD-dependent oxidoreductase [Candidatus Eisenbacteria bacterium]
MSGKLRRIVIVGGGATGPKAASRARRLDPTANIKIIEKGKDVSYGACGMPYYVSGDVGSTDSLVARTPEYFREQLNVDVLTETEVLSVDTKSHSIHCLDAEKRQTRLPYDHLVLSTGAIPIIPPLEGRELAGIFKLKDLSDARGIVDYVKKEEPRRAAIIGAGLIGLEMAEAFRARGLAVTIVEMLEWPLATLLDLEMAALVTKHLEAKGVNLLLSQRAASFEGSKGGRVRRLLTQSESVDCDIVLAAVGVRPNVTLAQDAGLGIGKTRAISVNEFLQTTDPAVFAGGDCVECTHVVTGKPVFVPLGSTANKHGRVIGTNVTGGRDRFPGVLGTAVAKVFDISVGRTGLSEKEAKEAGYDTVSAIVSPHDIVHYYPGSHRITLKLVAEASTGKVLGAQCIGEGEVAKRIDVVATAITSGMNVEHLSNLDLAYAPPFNAAMDAIHHAANVVRNKIDGTARSVSPAELKKKLNGQENLVVLDVRSEPEWRTERIDSPKVRHLTMSQLTKATDELCKGKEVVTYCRSSVRAYQAQKLLERKGCADVKFLDGSLSAWPYAVKKRS